MLLKVSYTDCFHRQKVSDHTIWHYIRLRIPTELLYCNRHTEGSLLRFRNGTQLPIKSLKYKKALNKTMLWGWPEYKIIFLYLLCWDPDPHTHHNIRLLFNFQVEVQVSQGQPSSHDASGICWLHRRLWWDAQGGSGPEIPPSRW